MRLLIEVGMNTLDRHRVFHAGDLLGHRIKAGFDVDVRHRPEALRTSR